MTDTATYPSDEAPAFPGVTLPHPESWEVLPVPAALIALGKSGYPANQFQPNVVVTNQRGIGTTLEEAAAATAEALTGSPEWEEAGRETIEGLGGHQVFRIEGAFRHPQAGTVYQAAVITVVERGPYTDLVQLVGSCSASQVADCLPEIRTILKDATVTG